MSDVRVHADDAFEGMDDDTLIARGDIAYLAGVAPSLVKSWASRNRDFPKVHNRGQRYGLHRYGDVIAWLCRHHKLDCEQHADMLNIEQVADRLGLSVFGLRRRRERGDFPEPATRVASCAYWTTAQIDAYIESYVDGRMARKQDA